MSNWPNKAIRHNKGDVFAEARRRGLFSKDAGETWLYMFHDIYGVAHFRHVDHRSYMQMLPDTDSQSPAEATQSRP